MGRPSFDFLFGFVAQRFIDKQNSSQDPNQNMDVLPFQQSCRADTLTFFARHQRRQISKRIGGGASFWRRFV